MTLGLILGLIFGLAWTSQGWAVEPPESAPAMESASPQPESEEQEDREEEPQKDEEDALLYRLLAAPEYLWKGFAYPIKKMSIFYERVDLLDRTLDLFLNEDRTGGIYPRFALGGVISTGIGLTAFENNLFNKGKKVRASYLFGVRRNQSAELTFTDPALLGSRLQFETEISGIDFDQGRFFPEGNRAGEEELTQFSLEQLSGAARVGRPLFGDLSASFLGRFYAARGEESDRGGVQIPLSTPGVNTTVHAVELEPALQYDSRDNPFAPSTGWLLDVAFTYTDQVNRDDFRYLGYVLEVQRYIPVFRGNRILMLRGVLAKQSTLDDRAIPFYELNTLDLNHGLRGFSRGRWRDRGLLLFNVEWRFPVWERFHGSIFYDAGQVFRDFRDLEVRTFRYSAGVGFRFATARQFAFRAHVAVSEDGVLALIKGDLEFQRKRGVAFGGL